MSLGVGKRIKERRLELNLTQEELAHRMGYKSKAAVCKVESGEDNITSDRLEKFANALSCTPAYLMGWEDNVTQIEFDKSYDKYGTGSRLAFYLDALSKLSDKSKEEVFSYIDYQSKKDKHES